MKRRLCQLAVLTAVFIANTNVIAQEKAANEKKSGAGTLSSQKATKKNISNLVYVDKSGVLRYTSGNGEASFFGVNYIAPFAHPYRALKSLNIDLEKAIQQDVYHMARLGLDAFRIRLWDTEISDTAGNLIENEHLRLFDFLLAELKKRKIKTIITPIAFWGNGFPEKDEPTPGFSRKYGKAGATINDTAIAAQENYLKQLFNHLNLYTQLSYGDDPDVIAVELNNEPNHSGPSIGVTNYINRLAAAVKSTGWTKPLFYNISLSFNYADAVAKANIDGCSFHWYATGSPTSHPIAGNFLPNVDRYDIPYDTIPAFRNKAKMVYEFDAPDMLQSCMYPMMAKSFRGAGFQWATQFAYDPMDIAYANTEHPTHYLNLAYTPSKAISFMIASKVFHQIPRKKNYGTYPADSTFDVFRVSYKESLSEMNSSDEFYYSNSTQSKPVNINMLLHLAGVGNSPVVKYAGSGAYFLDKLGQGVWRLEVMPDAVSIRNPFENASLKKEVTRIEWHKQAMGILLPDIGYNFVVKGLDSGNNYLNTAAGADFLIEPGTYLVTVAGAEGKKYSNIKTGVLGLDEFAAPLPFSNEPFVVHTPMLEVSAGKPFNIEAKVVGIEAGDSVLLLINKVGDDIEKSAIIHMTKKSADSYSAQVPLTLMNPGAVDYRIIIKKVTTGYHVFPGNQKGHPLDWDYYNADTWQTFVVNEKADLEIYNPVFDKEIWTYPSFRNGGLQRNYIAGTDSRRLALKLAMDELKDSHTIGFQLFFADKLKGRQSEIFDKLVLRARTAEAAPVSAKISLINKEAICWSAVVTLNNNFMDIEIPFNTLMRDSILVLPVSTPEFMPLWFKGSVVSTTFKLADADKIQVTIGSDVPVVEFKKPYSLEVESIKLRKQH